MFGQMALLAVRVSYYNQFCSAIGGLASQLLLTNQLPADKEDIWTSSIVFGLFFIVGRCMCRGILARTAFEQFHQIKVTDKLQSQFKYYDYELIPFVINRIRMYLGTG